MKIRLGFVSNSSSSSFIVSQESIDVTIPEMVAEYSKETTKEKLLPNNRYGIVSKGLNWLPLSNDENLEHEVYIVHFEPDSSSNFHRHIGYEEFYVLDGELIDGDGKVFKKGDYIKFEKGSEHSSFSKTGCTLLVILYGGTNELINWLSNDWTLDQN